MHEVHDVHGLAPACASSPVLREGVIIEALEGVAQRALRRVRHRLAEARTAGTRGRPPARPRASRMRGARSCARGPSRARKRCSPRAPRIPRGVVREMLLLAQPAPPRRASPSGLAASASSMALLDQRRRQELAPLGRIPQSFGVHARAALFGVQSACAGKPPCFAAFAESLVLRRVHGFFAEHSGSARLVVVVHELAEEATEPRAERFSGSAMSKERPPIQFRLQSRRCACHRRLRY